MVRNALLAFSLTVGLAAPALALAPHYQAEPTVAPAAAKLALRDTLWRCGEGGCAATQASASRPAIVCSVLASEIGTLRSFTAAGQPLSAEALAKCNARAKAASSNQVQTAASQ